MRAGLMRVARSIEVARIEQAGPAAGRWGHEIGIGDIQRAVGKGQARGFGVGVQKAGGGQTVGAQWFGASGRAGEQTQNLTDRQGPRTWRREAAQAPFFGRSARWLRGWRVRMAQGSALHRPVALQIGQCQAAGVGGVLAHFVDHGLRHRAPVQGVGSFQRDAPQHSGQFRILEPVTDRMGLTIGLEKVGRGDRVFLQRGFGFQQPIQARAYLEAVFCQRDGRFKQFGPRQLAVLSVGQGQHGHGARHAHRAPTDHRFHESHGFAVGAHEKAVIGCLGWRGFAAVEGLNLLAVVVQQKGAATNAAGLGLDQREHHLHRHGRVDCAATGTQYGCPGLAASGLAAATAWRRSVQPDFGFDRWHVRAAR